MDQCLIDVGEVDNVHLGDIVTLIGTDNGESIRVEDVAAAAGTIPRDLVHNWQESRASVGIKRLLETELVQ